jgi:hypothetical protein
MCVVVLVKTNMISFTGRVRYLFERCFILTFFLLRNMLPEVAIALSSECQKFFILEDYEISLLVENRCPYSRISGSKNYGSI